MLIVRSTAATAAAAAAAPASIAGTIGGGTNGGAAGNGGGGGRTTVGSVTMKSSSSLALSSDCEREDGDDVGGRTRYDCGVGESSNDELEMLGSRIGVDDDGFGE